MNSRESTVYAQLLQSSHAPFRAPLDECLSRWRSLDRAERLRCYLLLEGPGSARRTLSPAQIAELAVTRDAYRQRHASSL